LIRLCVLKVLLKVLDQIFNARFLNRKNVKDVKSGNKKLKIKVITSMPHLFFTVFDQKKMMTRLLLDVSI